MYHTYTHIHSLLTFGGLWDLLYMIYVEFSFCYISHLLYLFYGGGF